MRANFSGFVDRLQPRTANLNSPMIDVAFRARLAPTAGSATTEIDYHAAVQSDLVQSLRDRGATIEENIRLFTVSPNPSWTYDTDFISKPGNGHVQCVVEIKTSLIKKDFDEFDGSEFKRKQFQVIILANLGGHVMSANLRLLKLSLPVGALLPPLAVMIVYALPGRLYRPVYVPPGDLGTLMDLVQ